MLKFALPRDPVGLVSIGLFVLTVTVFVGPRATTGVFTVIALITLGHLVFNPAARSQINIGPAAASLLALAAWSLVTALWAPEPGKSAGKAAFLALIIAAAQVFVQRADEARGPTLNRASAAVLLALLVGFAATSFELLTDQYLTRTIMTLFPSLQRGIGKHVLFENGVLVLVGDTGMNRRLALCTLLLWPALMLTWAVRGSLRIAAGSIAGLTAALILVWGTHQSSQVAVLLSGVAFALALWSGRWTSYLVAAAWCVSVVIVVPAATAAYRAELHKADWLFHTARHRIVIWGYTADQVIKGGFKGVGADATAPLHEQRKVQDVEIASGGRVVPDTGRHAHNVYLQVWYELGVLGALLFMVTGVALLRGISKLPARAQPFALAQFTAVAAMMGSSYSIWQTWFQAAIGLSALALLAGAARWQRGADPVPGRQSQATAGGATAVNPAE